MFSHRVQAGVKVPAPSNLTAFLITVKLLLLPSPTALQIAIWVASFSTNFWTSLCCIFFSIDMLCLGMDSGYSAPKCVASVYFFVILTWGGLITTILFPGLSVLTSPWYKALVLGCQVLMRSCLDYLPSLFYCRWEIASASADCDLCQHRSGLILGSLSSSFPLQNSHTLMFVARYRMSANFISLTRWNLIALLIWDPFLSTAMEFREAPHLCPSLGIHHWCFEERLRRRLSVILFKLGTLFCRSEPQIPF